MIYIFASCYMNIKIKTPSDTAGRNHRFKGSFASRVSPALRINRRVIEVLGIPRQRLQRRNIKHEEFEGNDYLYMYTYVLKHSENTYYEIAMKLKHNMII